MKILSFGSCNIDFVYSVPHFVKPGETISADDRNQFPGGKGLNQSIAMARAGAYVYHAGAIGSDGLFLRELLEDAGINTQYLKSVDAPSGHAIIQVDNSGENSIIIYSGANYTIDKIYIDEVLDDFSSGDIVVLQNEISNIEYITERAYAKGMRIILNPSPFHRNLKQIDLNRIYALVLNEIEASEFSGETTTEKICEYFRTEFPKLKVALTLGSNGSIYFDKEKEVYFPSYSVKIKDTTSAGDTYTGYFISGLEKALDIESTLKYATAAAALAVSRQGAASSIPYMHEVEEALKALKANTSIDIENRKTLVLNYIEENLTNAELDDVAKLLGYTKPYTTVWLKKHMKTSFSSLLKHKRCEKAAQLFRETSLPIDEIIKQAGYENGGFFRTIFKEQFGKSPLEYRKFYCESEVNNK